MEQSTSSNAHIMNSSLSSFFTDNEIEIAHILLNLPNLIYESESRFRFSVNWGIKRRRSAINLTPSPSPSPSPSPVLQVEKKTKEGPKIKTEASSPATPLSFSPSESDGKSKHFSKKVSKKRTREEWMGIIDGLMQQRELLRGEIETVKGYYNKLKASNLKLKAKKQELGFYLGNPHLEMRKSFNNYGMKLSNQPTVQSPIVQNQDHPQIHSMINHQPSVVDQTAYRSSSHGSGNFQNPYGQIPPLKVKRTGGPLGIIPDLNVAAEETFGVDVPQPLDRFRALAGNRARAAEARRKRMVRIKEMKNSPAAVKPL